MTGPSDNIDGISELKKMHIRRPPNIFVPISPEHAVDRNDKITAYRGTSPYRDTPSDQLLFFARKNEIEQLSAMVVSSALTLLFGRSGLGKTSLINAGLLPEFRRKGYFPVMLRLGAAGELKFERYITTEILRASHKHGYNAVRKSRLSDLLEMGDDDLWIFLERPLLQKMI